MYLVGVDHPNKARAHELLRRLIEARERLITDVEVFQELLHRYAAIRRREAIEPAWRALEDLVDEVVPVHLHEVGRARDLVLENRELSARDALHVAVMETRGVEQILTFDAGFDALPGIRRIY